MTKEDNNKNKQEAHAENEERDEKRMPFLDHLEELRWRVIKSLVTVVVLSLGCYFVSEQIQWFLTEPFPEQLIFLALPEGFLVRLKISLFSGILLGLPVIFYQIWQFVVPGLFEKEKKYVPVVVFISTLCFLLGAAFARFIMIPIAIKFLMSFETQELVGTIRVNNYLSFVTTLMLVFGIVFEMPILSFFLTRIGIITPKFLRRSRRYGIVVILILAALLTPPDIVSQLLLGGPMVVLYEISIVVSAIALKRRTRALAEQEEAADS